MCHIRVCQLEFPSIMPRSFGPRHSARPFVGSSLARHAGCEEPFLQGAGLLVIVECVESMQYSVEQVVQLRQHLRGNCRQDRRC